MKNIVLSLLILISINVSAQDTTDLGNGWLGIEYINNGELVKYQTKNGVNRKWSGVKKIKEDKERTSFRSSGNLYINFSSEYAGIGGSFRKKTSRFYFGLAYGIGVSSEYEGAHSEFLGYRHTSDFELVSDDVYDFNLPNAPSVRSYNRYRTYRGTKVYKNALNTLDIYTKYIIIDKPKYAFCVTGGFVFNMQKETRITEVIYGYNSTRYTYITSANTSSRTTSFTEKEKTTIKTGLLIGVDYTYKLLMVGIKYETHRNALGFSIGTIF